MLQLLKMIFFLITIVAFFCNCNALNLNDRPVIGIVTEEVYNKSSSSETGTSMIYASYVKHVESSGARVVPIWIHKPKGYYEDILTKINGVLFPGGGVYLNGSGYGRTGKIIFDIATKMNDKGDYFPLWGTCLGFELLHYLVAKRSWMGFCDAQDLATNLQFLNGYNNSKMFSNLDGNLENSMINKNVVIHYHKWCLTPENYTLSGLDKYFKVLALNKDKRNLTFVSAVEAIKYPYYGVIFHPEKVVFEWAVTKTHMNIPHSSEAIKVSQYFGNFFVNEARKNAHRFPNKKAEDSVLIYNFTPTFTGKVKNSAVEQKYVFYN